MSDSCTCPNADKSNGVSVHNEPTEELRWRKVLATAIQEVDPDDARLSARIWDELPPDKIARLRHGEIPLPRWHQMPKLMALCDLSPDEIGQPIQMAPRAKRPSKK